MTDEDQHAKNELLEMLVEELEKKNFTLPTLPELAQKIRKAIEKPDTNVESMARMLSTDAAIAGRVIRTANSAIFAGLPQISDLIAAVSRLGLVCTCNIVISVSLAQLYTFTNAENMRHHLTDIWNHSTLVAATSAIIAKRFSRLDPYEAMLAGLIHNIGALPVITSCAERADVIAIPELLPLLIETVQEDMGSWILEEWHFPAHIVEIPRLHRAYDRHHSGPPDYVDVVMVSNLLVYYGKMPSKDYTNLLGISAFDRLGIKPEDADEVLQEANSDIIEILSTLR